VGVSRKKNKGRNLRKEPRKKEPHGKGGMRKLETEKERGKDLKGRKGISTLRGGKRILQNLSEKVKGIPKGQGLSKKSVQKKGEKIHKKG